MATTTTEQQIAVLIRALAKQPCPSCGSNPPETKGKEFIDGPGTVVDCLDCQGTGLANPWASEKCNIGPYHKRHFKSGCNGSGRVPKAVGLSLIIAESQKLGCYDAVADAVTEQVRSGWSSEGEITLAALRAVAGAKGL